MASVIEASSTITIKGQTTVPKSVRQALGVARGGKIAYRIEEGRVSVHNPMSEQRDPALTAFLNLIRKDIAAGRGVRDMPARLAVVLRKTARQVPVDLNAPLEGDVAL